MHQTPGAREWLIPVLELLPSWVHPWHLTLLRAVLTLPVIWLRDHPWLAVWVLILSSSFDFLDGELARHRNVTTELGATFDAVADKIFVLGTLFFACEQKVAPLVVALTTSIEVALLQVRFVEWHWKITTKSSLPGKIKTWVQSFGIAFILTREPLLEACAKLILPASLLFAGWSLVNHLASVCTPSRPTAST